MTLEVNNEEQKLNDSYRQYLLFCIQNTERQLVDYKKMLIELDGGKTGKLDILSFNFVPTRIIEKMIKGDSDECCDNKERD